MLDSAGSGNPVQAMRNDLTKALRTAKYLCSLATETPGLVLRSDGNLLDYTVRVPFGIVGRIIPFNHPLMFSLEKILPPLLVGNAVILKPSPYGCLAPLELGRVLSPHIPPGILNVVTDVHGQAGQALVAHPDIKRIAFTGSVETARRIVADSAATGPKQYSFELGGKNPLIVYPDVSAQDAADVATAGMNLKSTLGQSCGSTSRAFVHRDIYEDFLLEVRERFESLKPGLPTELDTEIGCLASQEQFNRVMSYIQQGLDEGARLITGGKRVADAELVNGHYMAPAIFADVDQSMSVAQEEIFGPVLCVLPWDEEAQMIKDVNSVAYGLTANIWTFDPSVADRLVKAIEAGYIFVRAQSLKHILGAPFGGVKQSGVGREGSLDEILSYTEVKNVAMYS
jgi:betaine-aldehyde dehydrogenase